MKPYKTCATCVYSGFGRVEPESTSDFREALLCRRYAPRIMHGSGAGWSYQSFPVVRSHDWCGEWEEVEGETPDK